MTSPARTRLPLTAIVAATVLALAAAGAVVVVLSGDEAGTPTTRLELTPEQSDADDPYLVPFENLDGTTANLAQFRGTPLVVNFFASTCPPCITEMPDLQAVSEQLGDRVKFVGLAVNDRTSDAAELVDDTGIDYFWALDRTGGLLTAVGAPGMPTTALFNADGEMVARHTGVITRQQLLDLIDEKLT